MSYNGNLPEIIRFGRGVRFQLADFLLSGKTLFICGRHSVDRIRAEWESSGINFEIVTVSGELPLDELENILSFARRFDCRNSFMFGMPAVQFNGTLRCGNDERPEAKRVPDGAAPGNGSGKDKPEAGKSKDGKGKAEK